MHCQVLCHREIASRLSAKLSSCEVIAFDKYNEQSISELVSDCDVLVSSLASKKIIENGKKLKFIQCWGVGVNQIDLSFAHQRGIKVSNLTGFNSASVADYILSAILLLTIRIHAFDKELKQGSRSIPLRAINRFMGNNSYSFSIDGCFEIKELTGKVLSIIGYGAIGQQIALRANAFGMRIMAIKRTPLVNTDLNVEFVGTLGNLRYVLQNSDFVSVNLPLTKETRGIFGAAEFASMKPAAYFINSSRAEVVNHNALLTALKNHSIAGAVLDVVDESLKKSFARLNNVILTPHISGESEESAARGIGVTAENINRLIHGRTLLNCLSPEKMY
jgi:phosphoglycerate dehydrogenase-like enzyme